jgi:hypothetical protein
MGSLPLPTGGGALPPACMYNTQKHLLIKILDTVDSIQAPVESNQFRSSRLTLVSIDIRLHGTLRGLKDLPNLTYNVNLIMKHLE